MLPHQAPLYNAFDALQSNDLQKAESEIHRFFDALVSDSMAINCRRHHFNRQVFEADYVSTLTKDEIDAWCVLSAVKMQRGDWKGAKSDCYRQIELIDQHYGFASASWQRPENRIPRDQELAERYFRIALHLTTICSELNDGEMSTRWTNITNVETDKVDPDEIWGRWVAEEGDDVEPVGLHPHEFPDWSNEKVDVDGETWMVNLSGMLPQRASPRKYSMLAKVYVATDPTCDVPTKATRWRIWSLRQAIASRLQRNDVGIYFGELQRRGERVLLYYATNEDALRTTTADILDAAAELAPRLEIRKDMGWKEYSKWGGSSITVDASSAVPLPNPLPQEHENDLFLRETWNQCESISSVWSRMYTLLWVANLVPPHSATMREYCVDYLFEQLNSLTQQETEFALWYMVWKLAKFNSAAAVRALDMLNVDESLQSNQGTANLCAEALADFEPERALQIVQGLREQGFTLLHKASGNIAVSIARTDPQHAREIIAQSREHILQFAEQPFSKVTYLAALAEQVHQSFPKETRALLREAVSMVTEIDSRSARAQVFMALSAAAKQVEPDLLRIICPGALETALALAAPPQQWMEMTGPTLAIKHICWLVPYVAIYNKTVAVEALAQATDMTCELADISEQLDLLSSLAEAAASLDIDTNKAIVERLWKILHACSKIGKVKGSSLLNDIRQLEISSLAASFVKMNAPLAVGRLEAMLAISRSFVLPERQVDMLCSFADSMRDQRECAKVLIAEVATVCRECSSAPLRANALARLAVVMCSLGLRPDENGISHEVYNTINSISSQEVRLTTLLDVAKLCAETYSELANRLLEKALEVANELEDVSPSLIEQLNGLPAHAAGHRLSRKLFFTLVKKTREDRLSEQLTRFASNFAVDTI